MKKRAMIIGNLRSVVFVTQFLVDKGYQVLIISQDHDEANQIASITSMPVLCGNGTYPEVLQEAKMQSADIAVAMMQEDESNYVAALLCKRLLNIKSVVAVLSDATKIDVFYQSGIDSVICEAASIVGVLHQQIGNKLERE